MLETFANSLDPDEMPHNVASHQDPNHQTINVASRVFTRQNVDDGRRKMDDGQKAITKAHHEHVVLSALVGEKDTKGCHDAVN
ncbi:hypothetical protein DPMN_185859 [Dreissena polymorpha]|uniref:Uncharacterized protein n=1 Tax=Dreissena polymorpha TaxID=45954 RepID=A0A9D4DM90_DREPO|nr:hypothetical protein DPMN_185859 [Dreissena polymorpha]